MTTKLESMIGHLAGRVDDPTLLKELADPSSEASRFLEATRNRSRALLDQPAVSAQSVEPKGNRSKLRKGFERLSWASMAILALGATLWVGEIRVRRLESILERANAEDRAWSEKLETALTRLANSTADNASIESAIGRVVARLDQFENYLQAQSNRPEPTPKLDPTMSEVRDLLAAIRRELSSGEKISSRRAEDLQTTINDVARLLRLLVKGAQPSTPVNEVPPLRIP